MKVELGFFWLLTLLFAAAKLLGLISWSWWIVFSPAIVGSVLGALIIVLVLVVVALTGV